ncbi:DNA helicase IV, partial [Erwinia amylovora]|nr:DNA helicase IV [Erwinia amylovora]
ELEFTLPDGKVVRLHGTDWSETQRFYHHRNQLWQQWSREMSDDSATVLAAQQHQILEADRQDQWLSRSDITGWQLVILLAFASIAVPVERLV